MKPESGLFEKIDPYWNYWVKDFPLRCDQYTATDPYKFIAISDNKRILSHNAPYGKCSWNFFFFLGVIQKLKKLQIIIEKRHPHEYGNQFNRIKIRMLLNNNLKIIPENSQLFLLVGSQNSFRKLQVKYQRVGQSKRNKTQYGARDSDEISQVMRNVKCKKDGTEMVVISKDQRMLDNDEADLDDVTEGQYADYLMEQESGIGDNWSVTEVTYKCPKCGTEIVHQIT